MSGVRVKLVILVASVILIIAAPYYFLVYMPEQARMPYREAGLSNEQADSFIKKYPEQNGNYTWVSFAKSWVEDRDLAELAFSSFKDLNKALYFLSFVNSNSYDGANFLKDFPQFKDNYRDVLPAYSKNSSLVKAVHDQFSRDGKALDKNNLFLEALKKYEELNLIDKNLCLQTVQALNNLTIAYKQLKLPEHSKESIWLLINATQKSKDIVDFEPIVFKSVDNNHAYLIPEPARETWLTVEILKRIKESGFEIEKHPEMFLGLNGKVIANAWCFFNDSPYYSIAAREKEMNNREIKITDEEVLKAMMLQWDLYSKFAPQLGGGEKLYNRDFPWYNSTQLKALYPDKNELRVALFKLFFLPETTYSMKEGKGVFGIKAAETSLREAMEEYETIARLYPNGKIQTKFLGERSPRFFYYDWLDDRWHHGLSNTVSQFVGGWDDSKVQHGPETITYDWIENQNGLDQFLTRNWKYWDLVKFIIGYERWNPKGGAHEAEGIAYIMPAV
ncbi:MAG: hypothetical protein JTT13_04325 [Candidatus Brockarchaeota archaeon]|nr:hypothetical protein [Candidatus Brockarchaeota archaeon]